VILLEPRGAGTKYTGIADPRRRRRCQKHANMGFHDGWGKALDQLVTFAKRM
jgi:hypothetical protein